MALLQYIETIMEHGEQLAQDSLKKNPAKLITLLNACSNMSNANIALEKHKPAPSSAPSPSAPS